MRTSVLTCARALGPQGGWGIHGALRKIRLILLLLSSFPCFSSAFASRLLRLFLFFDLPRHIYPIYTPSEKQLQPNSLISAQFSQNSLSPVPFPLWLTFAFVFVKCWSCSLEPPKRPKDVFLSLTVKHLIVSTAFAFGSKFHPALFFLSHISPSRSHSSHIFHHIFPSFHCCTSPPPLVQPFRCLLLSILTYFMTPSLTSVLSWPCSYVPSSFINLSKWTV